jgi:two-component system, cell cycle response regulator DivK
MRVLLVEDNELNRKMLHRRLVRRGYDVVLAADGAQGVALARALPHPDLVLMDMSLPVLDGWAATRALKADPETRSIPVIALTAHAMTGDRERALEAGCDDFETKPVDLDRVIAKIEGFRPPEPEPESAVEDHGLEIVREARVDNLPALMSFVTDICRFHHADEETVFALKLAVEEVFMNIAQHGYPDEPGPVTLRIVPEPDGWSVTVRDQGVPFDPSLAPLPDLASDWQDRPVGGLGWHLVRELMDEVRHEPGKGGGNVVTLIKRLPAGSP